MPTSVGGETRRVDRDNGLQMLCTSERTISPIARSRSWPSTPENRCSAKSHLASAASKWPRRCSTRAKSESSSWRSATRKQTIESAKFYLFSGILESLFSSLARNSPYCSQRRARQAESFAMQLWPAVCKSSSSTVAMAPFVTLEDEKFRCAERGETPTLLFGCYTIMLTQFVFEQKARKIRVLGEKNEKNGVEEFATVTLEFGDDERAVVFYDSRHWLPQNASITVSEKLSP